MPVADSEYILMGIGRWPEGERSYRGYQDGRWRGRVESGLVHPEWHTSRDSTASMVKAFAEGFA